MAKNRSPSALGGRSFGAVAGSVRPYHGRDAHDVLPADAVHIPRELRNLEPIRPTPDRYSHMWAERIRRGDIPKPKWWRDKP